MIRVSCHLFATSTPDSSLVDSLAFSLIPPTPQDLRNKPFPSPFHHANSVGSGLPFEIASPPPFGGIMSPKHEASQQHSSLRPQSGFRDTYTANHRRSSSVTSQGHRHEPYKTASRQSSISSLSGAMPLSDSNSSDWQSQWESADEARHIKDRDAYSPSPLSNARLSICPADLQVKPAALRAQRSMPSLTAQVPVCKIEQVDDAEESDACSEVEMNHTYSRKSRAKVPAPIIATEPFSQNGKAEATAGTLWSRSSGITRNSRKGNPQKSYSEDTEAPDSPILVTAITSSGKKSHARKVSQIFPGRAFTYSTGPVATAKPHPSSSERLYPVQKARRGFEVDSTRGRDQTPEHFCCRCQDVGGGTSHADTLEPC